MLYQPSQTPKMCPTCCPPLLTPKLINRATTFTVHLLHNPPGTVKTISYPSIPISYPSIKMRFDLPSQLLLLSSLPFLITSLPSQPRRAFLDRRYSVVAVDGSSDSAATSSLQPLAAETTIKQTIDVTETVTGPTKTVTPTTEILSTVTVQVTQPASTMDVTQPASTILKTVTKDTTSISTVSISVVDAAGPSTTSDCDTSSTPLSTLPASSTTTIPTSSSNATNSIPTTATSSLVSQYPTLPLPILSITPTTTLYTTAIPTYKPSSMQWHTTYPIWNATSTVATYQTASAASTGGVWRAL